MLSKGINAQEMNSPFMTCDIRMACQDQTQTQPHFTTATRCCAQHCTDHMQLIIEMSKTGKPALDSFETANSVDRHCAASDTACACKAPDETQELTLRSLSVADRLSLTNKLQDQSSINKGHMLLVTARGNHYMSREGNQAAVQTYVGYSVLNCLLKALTASPKQQFCL